MSCSIKEVILGMDRAVPRYTSYPTAPHFQGIENPQTFELYEDWLKSISGDMPLSLYIHVPFCSKMCWYCGCHTKVTKRYDPIADYVRFVLKEIEVLSAVLGRRLPAAHIHFGGGTPGLLSPFDFSAIMKALDAHFDIDYKNGEIAMEIDPRSVNEARVESYTRHGLNRVSLGVQDLHSKTLDAVNRPQPFELSMEAVSLFRRYGVARFNIDLLYGLPHQTVESMAQTIERCMALAPDRLSLFGYAHVPWMKKHMKLIDEGTLPDKNDRYDLFRTGEDALLGFGYVPIGIDHFAKEDDPLARAAQAGTLQRNFQGYTTDKALALIGIGVSSIGKLEQGYVQNAVDMPVYKDSILNQRLSVRKFLSLSHEDRLRAHIIERLMCDFHVDIQDVCLAHGFEKNHLESVLPKLEPFVQQNMLVISENKVLTILPHARLVARLICAEFDAYFSFAPQKPRHAKAI
ncbi:MAG: oxygen-independent coproporphyrinogen III oxidase [Alphaproteobacteria bacterium]